MSAGPVICSTHPLHPEVSAALSAMGDFRVAATPTPADIDAASRDSEIIVVRAPIAAGIVRREQGLRALVRHGAGLDMIPVDVATQLGVLVANVPGANARTVAEHAIWSAAALLRRYPLVSRDLRAKGWEEGRRHSDYGREMSGKTLGIVGLGAIGRAVARIASAGFGMTVVAHTRSPDPERDPVPTLALPDLLTCADVVVLCCPLTDHTRGLIDAAALRAMRPGAILVNVSRGPITVEAAVLAALRSGHLGGAALDVFDTQPLPADHPFLGRMNVIVTPHMAGVTAESMLRMGQGVVDHVRTILTGGLPATLVNPEAVQRYRARFP